MTRRLISVLAAAALVTLVAGTTYWAGLHAAVPPALPVASVDVSTYRVEAGTVGRSTRVTVSASWPTVATLYAAASGVVTSIPQQPGVGATAGDMILTIDLEPVILAIGKVPMFRTLRPEVQGADVAQFQRLLIGLGYLTGQPSGTFDATTVAATQRWQRSTGATITGSVPAGALVFVDDLPARVVVDVAVGARVAEGQALAHVVADSPRFIATVTASEAAELSGGLPVTVAAPSGGGWHGMLGPFRRVDDSHDAIDLTGSLCADECEGIAFAGETELSGTIEVTAPTRGMVVPTSALVLQPSGSPAVTLADGSVRVVHVVAEADGFAAVEGLEVGTVIRLPSPPGG